MKKRHLKIRTRPRVPCSFCNETLPVPAHEEGVFSGDGCSGGRCACGAVFVVDETGRMGGQALLDAQAMLCEGDLDAALRLDSNTDFEVQTQAYRMMGQGPMKRPSGPVLGGPQAWILRKKQK